TGLGYNVIPPPYTGNFMPPTPDLFSLEEFVNEPIVSEPTVNNPVVKTSKAKASADKPKVVRKNFGSLLIEDWISDSEDEDESKECRAPKSQDTTHKEGTRRTVPVETPGSTALVSCDGLEGYDWSDQAEDGPTNFTLMAYSSTSSNSE
nr:hypothetical protein [Tanacetum cinerariifolium]